MLAVRGYQTPLYKAEVGRVQVPAPPGKRASAGRPSAGVKRHDWVAVKELKLSYYVSETILNTMSIQIYIYIFVRIPITVTYFKFLSSNPDRAVQQQV